MTRKYVFATLPVVSEYDGTVKDQKVQITNRPADSDRCCGRTAGWGFETGSCKSKGKYVHENVLVETTQWGEEPVAERRTVQFCGTHDPVRRAEKARDEYVLERQRQLEAQDRQTKAQAAVNDMVREINELAGGKVVEAGWSRYSNQPQVQLYSPASLLDALKTLTREKETVS